MDAMVATVIAFAVLGLIIGSFLNVVILRYGARAAGGRSACMSCGAQLSWHEMIPVFSWLALRGRCRHCGSRISAQYPIVEATTAILFALVAMAGVPAVLVGLALVITAFFIAIAAYDIRHTIIPDPWVWTLDALALAWGLSQIVLVQSHDPLWVIVLAGPAVAMPLFLLWAVSRGRWMGFGDVKLALSMGWLLGATPGFYALMLAFVIGAVVSVGILLPLPYLARVFGGVSVASRQSRRFTMKSEIPFGPFLIAATFIVWYALLYGINPPLLETL